MAEACLHGLYSAQVMNRVKNTVAWPKDASEVDVAHLLRSIGAGHVSRLVDPNHLNVRLGPEARGEMDQPVASLTSFSNRERAVLSTSASVLAATNELDTAKELARKTKKARYAWTSRSSSGARGACAVRPRGKITVWGVRRSARRPREQSWSKSLCGSVSVAHRTIGRHWQ